MQVLAIPLTTASALPRSPGAVRRMKTANSAALLTALARPSAAPNPRARPATEPVPTPTCASDMATSATTRARSLVGSARRSARRDSSQQPHPPRSAPASSRTAPGWRRARRGRGTPPPRSCSRGSRRTAASRTPAPRPRRSATDHRQRPAREHRRATRRAHVTRRRFLGPRACAVSSRSPRSTERVRNRQTASRTAYRRSRIEPKDDGSPRSLHERTADSPPRAGAATAPNACWVETSGPTWWSPTARVSTEHHTGLMNANPVCSTTTSSVGHRQRRPRSRARAGSTCTSATSGEHQPGVGTSPRRARPAPSSGPRGARSRRAATPRHTGPRRSSWTRRVRATIAMASPRSETIAAGSASRTSHTRNI